MLSVWSIRVQTVLAEQFCKNWNSVTYCVCSLKLWKQKLLLVGTSLDSQVFSLDPFHIIWFIIHEVDSSRAQTFIKDVKICWF